MSEHDIQSEFVRIIEESCPDILFCATVGGARMSIAEAKKIKRAGYRKGVPDVIFYESRHGHHGLCVEIKKKGGQTSPHQKKWLSDLQRRGYLAVVCKGLNQCLAAFNDYFGTSLVSPDDILDSNVTHTS